MAISGKYGRLNIPRIGEEEPVFVLRAQDRLAEPAIEMYRLAGERSRVRIPLGAPIESQIHSRRACFQLSAFCISSRALSSEVSLY